MQTSGFSPAPKNNWHERCQLQAAEHTHFAEVISTAEPAARMSPQNLRMPLEYLRTVSDSGIQDCGDSEN